MTTQPPLQTRVKVNDLTKTESSLRPLGGHVADITVFHSESAVLLSAAAHHCVLYIDFSELIMLDAPTQQKKRFFPQPSLSSLNQSIPLSSLMNNEQKYGLILYGNPQKDSYLIN